MTDQPTPAVEIGAGTGAPAMVGTVLLVLGDSIAAGIGASHVSCGCMTVLAHIAGIPIQESLPFVVPVVALFLYGRHRTKRVP